MWSVEKWLQFMFSSKTYFGYMQHPEELEIIVRSDGIPVGRRHASFLVATLGNFDVLSKCIGFNFPINIAEVNEKNREDVREAFRANLEILNNWSLMGHVEVFPGVVVKVRVE